MSEAEPTLFGALSSPVRLRIIDLLHECDMTAGELASHFSLAPSTLSGHFRYLRTAGLIVGERRGNHIWYSLNLSALEEALSRWLARLARRQVRDDRDTDSPTLGVPADDGPTADETRSSRHSSDAT